MTKTIFAITFDSNNKNCWNHRMIQGKFDFDKCPMIFSDLDDAKQWIFDVVDNVIIPVDSNIMVHGDDWFDSALNEFVITFGTGNGASQPWMSVIDDDGNLFEFWIHQIDVH